MKRSLPVAGWARWAGWAAALGLAALVAGAAWLWPAWRQLAPDRLARSSDAVRERAAGLAERARDFDADAALAALGENARNGPIFRFDERLAEARRLSETPWEPPPTGEGVHFEFDGRDPVAFAPVGAAHAVEGGVLAFDANAETLLASGPGLAIPRDEIGAIELRVRARAARRAELLWSKLELEDLAGAPPNSVGSVFVNLVPDDAFHTYRLDATVALQRRLGPGDAIRSLWLRPTDAEDDRLEIEYLRFVPKRVRFAAEPFGRGHETRDGETRGVLWVNAPGALAWRVRVPEREPRLRLGTTLLDPGPVTFRVEVADGAAVHEVLRAERSSPAGWRDQRVELDAWAGREVEVRLVTEADAPNVAFWSNPILYGRPAEPFHVIVVLEDTLRADRLSLYGHGLPTSPVKERLAERGVVFERAFSQATKTRPSVPSFMTSLYPSANGVHTHRHLLDERFLTLAEILRSQGFATASFIQNSNAGPAAGLHQGFDHVFTAVHRGTPAMYGDGPLPWLAEQRDRNVFLYVHVRDPHGRFEPEAPFDRWYREAEFPGTPVEPDRKRFDPDWVETPTAEGRRLLYDGEIAQNDFWFERFLEGLDGLGILEHAALAFISDHGEHLGERGRWSHNPPGYVQVLRVPLMLVRPGALPEGRRVAAPVQLLDLMPTLLELAGVPREGLLLQGDSLVPLARGEQLDYWSHRVVVSEEAMLLPWLGEDEVSASAFYRDWHLLTSVKVEETEVYDLARDPQEERPVESPLVRGALARRLEPMLLALKRENQRVWQAIVGREAEVIEYDPDAQDQLRALGYIE